MSYFIEKMRAKIHNGVVTAANKDYEGSVTIGEELLYASKIEADEKVQVLNITHGDRIETYVIPGKGREICLNGAAAHHFAKGNRVIIIAYGFQEKYILSGEEKFPKARRVILDGTKENHIKEVL
jgi:aspartate 1-decarboxylase